MEEKLYCYGCGQILQCEDETKAGYVPDKILETKENILCQRCFTQIDAYRWMEKEKKQKSTEIRGLMNKFICLYVP